MKFQFHILVLISLTEQHKVIGNEGKGSSKKRNVFCLRAYSPERKYSSAISRVDPHLNVIMILFKLIFKLHLIHNNLCSLHLLSDLKINWVAGRSDIQTCMPQRLDVEIHTLIAQKKSFLNESAKFLYSKPIWMKTTTYQKVCKYEVW